MTSNVDYIEVGRKASELESNYGREGAHAHAGRLAVEAARDGEPNNHDFWRAVQLTLTSRDEG